MKFIHTVDWHIDQLCQEYNNSYRHQATLELVFSL